MSCDIHCCDTNVIPVGNRAIQVVKNEFCDSADVIVIQIKFRYEIEDFQLLVYIFYGVFEIHRTLDKFNPQFRNSDK